MAEDAKTEAAESPLLLPPGDRMPRWVPRAILLAIVFVIVAMGVMDLLRKVNHLLVWMLIAAFLSFALEPAVNFFVHKYGWRRGAVTGLVMLIVILSGLGLLVLVVPVVVKELVSLVDNLPSILDSISVFTKKCCGVDLTDPKVLENLTNVGSTVQSVASNILQIGGLLASTLFSLLTILTFTFFFVANAPALRRSVLSVVAPQHQQLVLETWEVAIQKTGGYFYSRLLLAVINAVVSCFMFTWIGVPFAIVMALFLGFVAELIPTIGPWLGAIPVVIVATIDNPTNGMMVLIYLFAYQAAENFFLVPKLTAKTMKMNAAVAFGAVIAGASIAGIVGAFLALPFAGILQASISGWLSRGNHRYEVPDTELTRDDSPKERGAKKVRPFGRHEDAVKDEEPASPPEK